MSGLELLETYPKAAEIIKQFFVNQLVDSLNDADLPEDFKEFAREQEIGNERVGTLIDNQPRGLFDVFDANSVYIEITVIIGEKVFFIYHINGVVNNTPPYYVRKEAEASAIEKAFQILNDKL
jgi:hypothetical protein